MQTNQINATHISSEDIAGTAVYSTADREKIGDIHHLMIDRAAGRVGYAVISFGGFLGIGENHYPIPWNALKYDSELEGYLTGITQEHLDAAEDVSAARWSDRDWETRVHNHYGAPYYWEGIGTI